MTSDLVKDDRHDEEVQQEALGGVRAVKVEKDEREEKSDELETGVTERRAQEFQPSHGGQQNIAAAEKHPTLGCAHACSDSLCTLGASLDSQLLAVTEGEAVVGECAQHDGGVHDVLLKAQQPDVQALKPHQHGVLCNQETD